MRTLRSRTGIEQKGRIREDAQPLRVSSKFFGKEYLYQREAQVLTLIILMMCERSDVKRCCILIAAKTWRSGISSKLACTRKTKAHAICTPVFVTCHIYIYVYIYMSRVGWSHVMYAPHVMCTAARITRHRTHVICIPVQATSRRSHVICSQVMVTSQTSHIFRTEVLVPVLFTSQRSHVTCTPTRVTSYTLHVINAGHTSYVTCHLHPNVGHKSYVTCHLHPNAGHKS